MQQQISNKPVFYSWFIALELAKAIKVSIDGCEYVEDSGYIFYIGIAKKRIIEWI